MVKIDQVNVVRFISKMLFEKKVDCAFEHEGVIDCNHIDFWLAVPTWLASSCDRTIHDIVRNKEECL